MAAREQLSLDRVLMVVANLPWQKVPQHEVAPAADRLALVQVACEGHRGLEASALEIERGGPSYTADTVKELLARGRARSGLEPEIFLVIGGDLVASLDTWERVDELRPLVTLAVVTRAHIPSPAEVPGWRACAISGVDVDVSSSEVRRRLAQGLSVEGMVPDPVARCIRRRRLYAVGR